MPASPVCGSGMQRLYCTENSVSSGGQLPVPPALCNTQMPTLPRYIYYTLLLWICKCFPIQNTVLSNAILTGENPFIRHCFIKFPLPAAYGLFRELCGYPMYRSTKYNGAGWAKCYFAGR